MRLPPSPTPENFSDAVKALVEPIAEKLGGGDARVTKSEARDGVRSGRISAEESELASETIRRAMGHKQKPAVSSVVEGIGRRAFRAAKKAAGSDGRLSASDARKALPSDLAKLFVELRSGPKKPVKKPPASGGEAPAMPPPAFPPVEVFGSAQVQKKITIGEATLARTPISLQLAGRLHQATQNASRAFNAAAYTGSPQVLQAILADPARLAAFAGQLLTDPFGRGHAESSTSATAQATVVEIADHGGAAAVFDQLIYGLTKTQEPELYLEWSPLVQPLASSVAHNFDFGPNGKLFSLEWHDGDETTYRGLAAINPDSGEIRSLIARPASDVIVPWENIGSGAHVDLQGHAAEIVQIGPEAHAIANSTPSEYSTFADAYRLATPADAADTHAVAAALAHTLEWEELSDGVVVAPASAQTLGQTLAEMLEGHSTGTMSAGDWNLTRANYDLLAAAMLAGGATHTFTARHEESGDYSYLAVVAANTDTGDLKILGFRRDPS